VHGHCLVIVGLCRPERAFPFRHDRVAMPFPITLVAVRPMSRKWSMPMMSSRPASGSPNIGSTAATTTSDARGTPATPLLVSMSVSIINSCCESGIAMPAACAANTDATAR